MDLTNLMTLNLYAADSSNSGQSYNTDMIIGIACGVTGGLIALIIGGPAFCNWLSKRRQNHMPPDV